MALEVRSFLAISLCTACLIILFCYSNLSAKCSLPSNFPFVHSRDFHTYSPHDSHLYLHAIVMYVCAVRELCSPVQDHFVDVTRTLSLAQISDTDIHSGACCEPVNIQKH
jgi:hypothetical protein